MTAEINAVTIHIPVTFKRRGGRKLVITPEGAASPVATPKIDDTLLKILVKAHRWRRRIETGASASVADLAEQEKVTIPYVSRLLAFTCLAPDIVAAILDGRQPRGLSANRMLKNVPEAWDEQRMAWGFLIR